MTFARNTRTALDMAQEFLRNGEVLFASGEHTARDFVNMLIEAQFYATQAMTSWWPSRRDKAARIWLRARELMMDLQEDRREEDGARAKSAEIAASLTPNERAFLRKVASETCPPWPSAITESDLDDIATELWGKWLIYPDDSGDIFVTDEGREVAVELESING